MPPITFSDFQKLDIRIGTITSAQPVPDTDKLLKLTLDFGSEQRQIIAGIAQSYPDPSTLIGQQIPVITNLEPKVIRGLESQGMILAAIDNGQPILLHPEKDLPPGSQVR